MVRDVLNRSVMTYHAIIGGQSMETNLFRLVARYRRGNFEH